MIVAVIAVWLVKVTVDEIVHVIAMRDGLVTAVRAVLVARCVARTGMVRGAFGAVRRVDAQGVLEDAVAVLVVKVAVVNIVDMTVVLDRGVAAVGAVPVSVILVSLRHVLLPSVLRVFGCMVQRGPNELTDVLVGE